LAATSNFSSLVLETSKIVRFLLVVVNTSPTFRGENDTESIENGRGAGPAVLVRWLVDLLEPILL